MAFCVPSRKRPSGPASQRPAVSSSVVTLSVSPSLEFQWAVQPFTQPDLVTNWSFRTPAFNWYHVALVNDGKTTNLYINGSKDVRNSHDPVVQTTGPFPTRPDRLLAVTGAC
jgi:hypothetical protein